MALVEVDVVRYDGYGNPRPRMVFYAWTSAARKKFANLWVLWR